MCLSLIFINSGMSTAHYSTMYLHVFVSPLAESSSGRPLNSRGKDSYTLWCLHTISYLSTYAVVFNFILYFSLYIFLSPLAVPCTGRRVHGTLNDVHTNFSLYIFLSPLAVPWTGRRVHGTLNAVHTKYLISLSFSIVYRCIYGPGLHSRPPPP